MIARLDPEKHTISDLLNFLQEAGKMADADHPDELKAIDTELDKGAAASSHPLGLEPII